MSIVYLAGGFKSGWQKKVISHHALIDPCEIEKVGVWTMDKICKRDRAAIEISDILFAYLEKDNPSGIGLSCEIGYACALKKTIILINEKEENKFDFLSGFCDFLLFDFEKGLLLLNSLK